MKAKLTVVFDALRGKAGNVVGKQSSSGQIMMVRSVGKDPRTQTQIQSRTLMKTIAEKWKTITPNQRFVWSRNALNGRSGYDLFFERNVNLNSIGQPFIENYMTPEAFTDEVQLSITVDLDNKTFTIKIDVTGEQQNDFLRVKISQFTPRLLSKESYKLKNIAVIPIESHKEQNVYDEIIKVNKGEPLRFQYAYMSFDKVSSITGNAERFREIVIMWLDNLNGYVPDTQVSINENNCYWNTKTLNANIDGKAEVLNFNDDWDGEQNIFLNIYNQQTGNIKYKTIQLLHRDRYEKQININTLLNHPFDTAHYPAGVTKYWSILSEYAEPGYGNKFLYESNRIPITAT